jgi:phosphatidylinositol 4-kinase
MHRFDRDLHSRILVSLASVLSDSRAKTTTDEVERLVSKCPAIPLLPVEDSTIVTPDQGSIGRMVVVDTNIKYIGRDY